MFCSFVKEVTFSMHRVFLAVTVILLAAFIWVLQPAGVTANDLQSYRQAEQSVKQPSYRQTEQIYPNQKPSKQVDQAQDDQRDSDKQASQFPAQDHEKAERQPLQRSPQQRTVAN